MNPYSPSIVSGNSTDTTNSRDFLQQAVDHYPRLAAFCFTLALPFRESMADYRSLILRFHTEVWQRIGEYSWQRQQARRHSPPTVLRWLWESVSAPECKMLLLMNLDTLGVWRDEVVQQEMYAVIRDAWRTVTGTDSNVTSMVSFIISRTEGCSFARPFSQLQTRVNEMVSPVMMARTAVVCP
ncbi:inovirus-type Gp2 protein [Escherichia coli]|uniref:inovirus-type Gp2 protein n=1 Tax=Escherichia coli TaxID=562 RepID=UPI001323F619|nr:inovirus-type Gp2 protein [Escherichia coli]EHW5160890.1 inovirus-type Gp2 protein [Escherichia coli]MXE64691.1 inovirus Gp2 family protein [Escherichia coli]